MSLKVRTICLRPSDSSVPRNARQIYNLKAKKRSEKRRQKNINALLGIMLEQFETAESYGSPLDDVQAAVHEYLYRSGGQLMFVLHLDQTSNDVSRSSTDCSPVLPSPLAFDTAFNIAHYKFTKSTDKNFKKRYQQPSMVS